MTSTAEDLTRALDRLRRAMDRTRLYGVGHPEAKAAIDEVWEPLSGALATVAPITLDAGLDGLSWRGTVLVEEDEEKEGVGRLLHREGIASITLHASLPRDELDRFLDVLRVNLALPEHEEDTLESLLWQAHLEGLTFTVVAALMEAESISGDVARYLKDRSGTPLDALLAGDGFDRSKRIILAHEALAAALQNERGADDDLWDEAGGEWAVRFEEDLAQDTRVVAQLREAIGSEEPIDQVTRSIGLLLRVVRARSTDLPPEKAIQLIRTAVQDSAEHRDLGALVRLTTLIRSEAERESDPGLAELFLGIVRMATDPYTAARLLSEAGPDADPAATNALVSMLDDAAVQALIEWSFPVEGRHEDEAERGRWLATALGDVTAIRARRWLQDEHTPPHLAVPAVQLLRGLGRQQDLALRPTLLRHPVLKVQEVVLEWYTKTGVPSRDVYHVLGRLEAPSRRVRRSTWPVFARFDPVELSRWFRSRLNPKALIELDEDLQVDLCVGCGRILGERAIPLLQPALDMTVGIFPSARESKLLLAAAMGLAAAGADTLLEAGARGWTGPRVTACKTALRRREEGTL